MANQSRLHSCMAFDPLVTTHPFKDGMFVAITWKYHAHTASIDGVEFVPIS